MARLVHKYAVISVFLPKAIFGVLPEADIIVDASATNGPFRPVASGFLFGMDANDPPDSLILPLRPMHFRMSHNEAFEAYQRVTAMGAKIHYVLSDHYVHQQVQLSKSRDPGDWDWPGDGFSFDGWRKTVTEVVTKAAGEGKTFGWEIWNEPNVNRFWARDQEQFFATWRVGVAAIRSVDSTAVIFGPSLSGYNYSYLTHFLSFGRQNGCLPDILTWHQIRGHESADRLAGDVIEIRAYMETNEIEISGIFINEILEKDLHLNPGNTVRYFAAIDSLDLTGACRSCWKEPDPVNPRHLFSNCRNQSMDGLLTPKEKLPRAPWWVYAWYGGLAGDRVAVQTGDGFSALATLSRGQVQLLLGIHHDASQAENTLTIEFRGLSHQIGNGNSLSSRISIKSVTNAGREPVLIPQSRDAPISYSGGDTFTLILPPLPRGSAHLITMLLR